MRRIYLESFIGLLIWFMASLFAYELIIYGVNTDYDHVLQEREGNAFRNVLLSISEQQGAQAAVDALKHVVSETSRKLLIVRVENLPEDVGHFFSTEHIEDSIYYDDDREPWFKLTDPNLVFHIVPDKKSDLWRAIQFDDDIGWVFILLGFFIYSLWFVWFLGRRIQTLEKVTMEFARGDLEVRAPLQSNKVVGTLNKSFNYMADKISNLISSNQFLANAVAHDLRTPIFRIQWQAEMLKDDNLTDKQHQKVSSIIEDTEEMERMVEDLLYMGKLERPEVDLKFESTDLINLIEDVVNKQRQDCSNDIIFDYSERVYVNLDSWLFRRALSNLILNAITYGRSVTKLNVSMEQDIISISVEDNGDGIPESHWPSIFKPFYSTDRSRNKSASGFGLGLAIVDLIVKRHYGHIEVGHSSLGGAKFTIKLPI